MKDKALKKEKNEGIQHASSTTLQTFDHLCI